MDDDFRDRRPSMLEPQLATEFLAASYYEQSQAVPDISLKSALVLARKAVTNAPTFGFAWVRVAELEFSFGHTRAAMDALEGGDQACAAQRAGAGSGRLFAGGAESDC